MRKITGLSASALVLMIGCGRSPQPHADGLIHVLVSILPQKQFVEAVGGNAVTVHVLIPPGASPATYDPKPNDLIRVEEAHVYFRIGHIGFEKSHLPKIESLNPDMQIVDTSRGIELRFFAEDEAHTHGHAAEDSARPDEENAASAHGPSGDVDPHVWMSPPAVKIQVATIAASLAEMAPLQAEQFRANAAAYTNKLDRVDKELKAMFAGLHSPNLLVFHPAWGYFADSYGLKQIAIEQAGKDPSPDRMQRIIGIAKASDIRVIFVQQQFSRGIARSVAEEIGGVVVTVDPLAADYLANLKTVGETIFEYLNH